MKAEGPARRLLKRPSVRICGNREKGSGHRDEGQDWNYIKGVKEED